jgi:hypothetical protein
LGDERHNALDIGYDFIVPKSENAVPLVAQIGIAIAVAIGLNSVTMMPAIQFDYYTVGVASEVRKIWTEWRLTSEVYAFNREATKALPKLALNIGRVAAQSTCSTCTLVRP